MRCDPDACAGGFYVMVNEPVSQCVGRVRRALRCLSRLIDIPRAVTRLSRLSWRRNAEGGLRRAARMMGLDVQRDARLIRPTLA